LVENNPSDIELTQRTLEKSHIANELVIAEDGKEALDYLFGVGVYAGWDVTQIPALVLLDLKLPRVDGLEVLRQLRADELTRRLPVVILTSSKESRTWRRAMTRAPIAIFASRLTLPNLRKLYYNWACTGWF
jgi:CheY-like chemotaxis protein